MTPDIEAAAARALPPSLHARTAPDIRRQMVVYDSEWWQANEGAVNRKWSSWLLDWRAIRAPDRPARPGAGGEERWTASR